MRITRVKSNLKVGCDVELGHKTLIVGPNGSGKSTIINAVELALTGRAGDIAGHQDVGREADVMRLAPKGSGELESIVTFDDGVVAAYRTSGSTAKAKKATGDKPADRCHDDVLPLRTLREAVLGSATTARKYLLSKTTGSVTRDDVKALIAPTSWSLWDKLIAAVDPSMPTADALVAVLEEAGKRQRGASEEAKTARGAARLVGDGYVSPPMADQLLAAKDEVRLAREVFAKAEAAASAAERFGALDSRMADARAKAERLAGEYAALAADLEKLPEPPGDAHLMECLETVMAQSVAAGACIPCGGAAPDMAARLADVRALMQDDAKSRAVRDALSIRVAAKLREAEAAVAALDTIEKQADELASFVGTNDVPVDAAESALDAAQKKLADMTAARDNWAIVQRSEATAQDAERRSEEWKALKTACEAAVGTVLNRAVEKFVASVQEHLPDGDRFDLRLRDGEREVVQFGLLRDGVLHTALSGAEWARVTVAMASACVEPGKFAVLVPEERAFDPKTLSAVLKSLTDCPHQVIMASPVAPKPVPKGWTVIERGE